MMMSDLPFQVVTAVCVILFVICLTLIILLFGLKLFRHYWDQRFQKRFFFYEKHISDWLTGIPGKDLDALKSPHIGDHEIIEKLIIGVVNRFTGTFRHHAIQFLEFEGYVKRKIKIIKKSRNHYEKALAIDRLGLMRSQEGISILLEVLNENQPEIRLLAARSLSRIGNTNTLPEIMKLLEKEPDRNVSRYIGIISAFGRNALIPLIDMFNNRSAEKRWLAVTLIGEIRDPNSIDLVGKLLVRETNSKVKAACIKSLSLMGDIKWVNEIGKFLNDSDEHVQIACAKALKRIRHPQSLSTMIQALPDAPFQVQYELLRSIVDYGKEGKTLLVAELPNSKDSLKNLIRDTIRVAA